MYRNEEWEISRKSQTCGIKYGVIHKVFDFLLKLFEGRKAFKYKHISCVQFYCSSWIQTPLSHRPYFQWNDKNIIKIDVLVLNKKNIYTKCILIRVNVI